METDKLTAEERKQVEEIRGFMSDPMEAIIDRIAPKPVAVKLLPCPFCGCTNSPIVKDGMVICAAHTMWIPIEDWNKRS